MLTAGATSPPTKDSRIRYSAQITPQDNTLVCKKIDNIYWLYKLIAAMYLHALKRCNLQVLGWKLCWMRCSRGLFGHTS